MVEVITPMNTVDLTNLDTCKDCVKTLLDSHGEKKTIEFIQSLAGFTEDQAKGYITLLTI